MYEPDSKAPQHTLAEREETRSSATAERESASAIHAFLGSLTDRALHRTPHLLYLTRCKKGTMKPIVYEQHLLKS